MKICLSLLFVLVACSTAAAQYHQKAIEQAKKLRLLADDSKAVKAVFHEFNTTFSSAQSDVMELGSTRVEIFYSTGECSDERLEEEVWDVPKGRIVRIEMWDDSDLFADEIRFDSATLEREQAFAENEDIFIFHSKKEGYAVRTSGGVADMVIFVPPLGISAKPCRTAYAKAYVEGGSWFGNRKLEDRFLCIRINLHASVDVLDLSHDRVSAVTSKQVTVTTKAEDPEGDALTYHYQVSGGIIRGSGAKVVWDLTGVKPGTYAITASVDDGAGQIGQRQTRTVIVE